MSNYTPLTNFGAKDSLPSGNAAKVIKGSEFTVEFDNIATAIGTKADLNAPSFTGTVSFSGVVNFSDNVAVDTDTLYVDVTNDRVGIGTSSPIADLHVSNGTNSDSTPVEFMIGGSANSVRTGSIVKGTTSGAYDLTLQTSNHATQNQPLIIKLSDATEAMRIDSSGNVGIGTSNPSIPLHLTATTNIPALIETTHTDGNARLRFTTASGTDWSIGSNTNGNFTLFDAINNNNIFVAEAGAGASTLVVDSNSRVGIGTDSPTSKLDVAGTIKSTSLSLDDNNKLLVGTGDDLEIYHDGSDSYIKDVGTGYLIIEAANNVEFKSTGTNEYYARFVKDGAVSLYYDNAVRLETRLNDTLFYGNGIAAGQMAHPSPTNTDAKLTLSGDTTFSETDALLLQGKDSVNIVAKGSSVNIGTDVSGVPQLEIEDTQIISAVTIKNNFFKPIDDTTLTASFLNLDDAHTFSSYDTNKNVTLMGTNQLNLVCGLNHEITFGKGGASAPNSVFYPHSSGNYWGFNNTSPTQVVDINDDSIRVRTAKTPASASDTGTQGQIAWDANYMYVCTATNTWKRVALATW
jgi:hypothetical protein